MNTLLPSADYALCAQYLDNERLWHQRNHASLILRVLHGDEEGWVSHPAVRMWRGYEADLVHYAIAMCEEWMRRKQVQDILLEEVEAYAGNGCMYSPECECGVKPIWMGGHIHSNHRSNLLRVDVSWYSRFNWAEYPTDSGYYWPV